MTDTEKKETAFTVRFAEGEGFNLDNLGANLQMAEMVAMMDACGRQMLHSRLSTIEKALQLHSGLLKQVLALINPPETEDDVLPPSETEEVTKEE